MVDGQKMSKSLGNLVTPGEMVEKYGIDATRYLLLTLGAFGEDWDVSWERMTEKYNSDLANGLGNLVSRTIKMSQKIEGEWIDMKGLDDKEYAEKKEKYRRFFDEGRAEQVLNDINLIVKKCDRYIDETKPWELASRDVAKFKEVMTPIGRDLMFISKSIAPLLPDTAKTIEKALYSKECESLFVRIK